MYSGVQEPDAPDFRNPQSSDPTLLGWTQGESQQRPHPSYLSIVLEKKNHHDQKQITDERICFGF